MTEHHLRPALAVGWTAHAEPATGLTLVRNGTSIRVAVPAEVGRAFVDLVSHRNAFGVDPPGHASVPDQLAQLLAGLEQRGIVAMELLTGRQVAARLEPEPGRPLASSESRQGERLARHVHLALRSDLGLGRDGMTLVAPGSGSHLDLLTLDATNEVADLLARMSMGGNVEDRGVPLRRLLLALCRMGRMVLSDGSEAARDDDLQGWEFHDAVFHARSRLGRNLSSLGPTGRRAKELEPQPVERPSEGWARLPLPTPTRTLGAGHHLGELLSSRRSRRDHAGAPLSLESLAAVLQGTFGVQRTDRPAPDATSDVLAWRAVPSGGALGGLSCYVVARRVDALAPGVHHYDGERHELGYLGPLTGATEVLLARYARAADTEAANLQAALVLTLNYLRPARKYEGVVYATALKEVGAAMQTVYLLGEAHGLSVCALGMGPPSSEGLGIPLRPGEAPVGELLIAGRARS